MIGWATYFCIILFILSLIIMIVSKCQNDEEPVFYSVDSYPELGIIQKEYKMIREEISSILLEIKMHGTTIKAMICSMY